MDIKIVTGKGFLFLSLCKCLCSYRYESEKLLLCLQLALSYLLSSANVCSKPCWVCDSWKSQLRSEPQAHMCCALGSMHGWTTQSKICIVLKKEKHVCCVGVCFVLFCFQGSSLLSKTISTGMPGVPFFWLHSDQISVSFTNHFAYRVV